MTVRTRLIPLFAAALSVAVAGCATSNQLSAPTERPTLAQVTAPQRDLIYLPPPPQPIAIAVYNFADQTGQLKPSENIQSLSRAVTQGGTSVLIKALRDAGNGNWFTVVERERLENLLRERQIIREMRQRYLGERETPANVLPSLLFAGILLEGGVIGYDTNTMTGGAGARFLAIGASTQYRQNTVTVYLRAVSVRTGEVLANVVTTKSVASVALQGEVFKFVTFDELLEGEVGVTANEPGTVALKEAIEKAVFALVLEGATPGPRQLWSFYDQTAGQAFLGRYAAEKAGSLARIYGEGPLNGAAPRPAPAATPAPAAARPGPRPGPAPARAALAEPISVTAEGAAFAPARRPAVAGRADRAANAPVVTLSRAAPAAPTPISAPNNGAGQQDGSPTIPPEETRPAPSAVIGPLNLETPNLPTRQHHRRLGL